MSEVKVVVASPHMITPHGAGVDVCWGNILEGKSAIKKLTRFATEAFQSDYAATIDGLRYHENNSLVVQMMGTLFGKGHEAVPEDAELIMATTKGEIDHLEESLISGKGNSSAGDLLCLLEKVASMSGAGGERVVLSAACASSSAAVAIAASKIRAGRSECVLVVACDGVTEFVLSGFSSLMALDKVPARPFDSSRSGLSVGEAAASALIMSESRAKKEKRTVLGEVLGWGLSDDANHMTGPSRESEGLILAIGKALRSAGADKSRIGFISAHGTGTVYNDAMEMNGFNSVFDGKRIPVYSIKGSVGHTMGAAGLVETMIALKSLRAGKVPPTVNLQDPDECARGWVSSDPRPVEGGKLALLTNAGFGGINAALVLG